MGKTVYEKTSEGGICFKSKRWSGDVRVLNYVYDLWMPLLGVTTIGVYSVYCRLERQGTIKGVTLQDIASACRIGRDRLTKINAQLKGFGFIKTEKPDGWQRLAHWTTTITVLDPPSEVPKEAIEELAHPRGYEPLTPWLVKKLVAPEVPDRSSEVPDKASEALTGTPKIESSILNPLSLHSARAEKLPSAEQPPTAMKSLDSSEQATSTPTPTATDELEGAEALDAFGLDKYTPDRAPTASNGDWTTRQREAQEKEPWLGWSDGKLHPSSGIGMDKLECIGWLIERETGRVPVDGQWKGWGKACAAIYQAGQGDFPAILEGIRRGWAREEQYRPRHPTGYVNEVANVKAAKKTDETTKPKPYSEAWYKQQMRDDPQRELNELAYERSQRS